MRKKKKKKRNLKDCSLSCAYLDRLGIDASEDTKICMLKY